MTWLRSHLWRFVLGDRQVRLFTVEEALRMLDAGVFENPKRLELLHGVLTEKPVKLA